jgi:hypothetical protein
MATVRQVEGARCPVILADHPDRDPAGWLAVTFPRVDESPLAGTRLGMTPPLNFPPETSRGM